MKIEDYKKLVTELTNAEDNREGIAKDIIDALEADASEHAAALQTIEEQNTKIIKLNETNSKLFLSVTGQAKNEPEEPEKTPEQRFAELYDAKYYHEEK